VVKPVNFDAFSDAMSQLGFYRLLLNQPPKLRCRHLLGEWAGGTE
jgi:hypothetical protein